uniref:TAFII55 protein conserved region domain-containing protein n=1 Tax=Panagrolaimus davidi TaxID=227884 RepID=A0A914PJF6_9BILA
MDMKESDFEWHAILRIPESKIAMMDEIIENQASEEMDSETEKLPIEPGESVLAIKFEKNLRRGQLRINEDVVGFCVRDLPCIVETYKTHDNTDLYKVADVSQILVCNDTENPPLMDEKEIENLNELASIRETRLKLSRFLHGLTPPMKNVTKRRFRKTKKTKFIDAPQIEQQLRGIFRRDMEANKIEFQLIDDDENRLDNENDPILPIFENANPFKRVIKSEPA